LFAFGCVSFSPFEIASVVVNPSEVAAHHHSVEAIVGEAQALQPQPQMHAAATQKVAAHLFSFAAAPVAFVF
jgi:hypothetical protein